LNGETTKTKEQSQNGETIAAPVQSIVRTPAPFYDRDGITIYCGKAEQVLPFLDPVDLVLTDPPYGIGEARANNPSRSVLAQSKDYGIAEWDDQPPARWLLDAVRAMGTWNIVFGGNYFELPPASCWLVWDKDNGANDFADCELAWTNLKKAVRRIKWRWQGMLQERGGDKKEHRVHPTQKPVAVMRWAISQAPEDVQTILDPFAGSGTTGIAARRDGKRCILIERELEYCEAIVTRLRGEPVKMMF